MSRDRPAPPGGPTSGSHREHSRRDTLGRADVQEATRVNKRELAAHVAARTSLSKSDAAGGVSAVFSAIADALASGEAVMIVGCGAFASQLRPGRPGRNHPAPERASPSPPRPRLRSRPARPFATPSGSH